jgi:hypothetical protein
MFRQRLFHFIENQNYFGKAGEEMLSAKCARWSRRECELELSLVS